MTSSSVSTKRVVRAFSAEEEKRYRELRAQINQEVPELVARSRLADEAAAEQTVSGALRRAIHESRYTLDELGHLAGIKGTWIDEFLTGERTLRSDVLDRLASLLGFDFSPLVPRTQTKSTTIIPGKQIASTGPMQWTAWNNGSHLSSGGGYGLKVSLSDRDAVFNRDWKSVILELPTPSGFEPVEVNVAKPSFWNDTCHELISQEIGLWLRRVGLAPWAAGQPPKINVEVIGEGRFRVTGGIP